MSNHLEALTFPRRSLAFWRQVGVGTLLSLLEPDTSLRCAGTAFFGFLSFFPAIGIVAFVYGLLADVSTLADTVGALRYLLPSAGLDVLREQLAVIVVQPPATLGFGLAASIILALWSGSRGVSALIYAMSRVRSQPERRGFFESLLVAVALTIFGSIFLTVALVTIAGLPALLPFPSGTDWLVLGLRWPILLILSFVILTALYRWGPDRHPFNFRFIWPGALLASLLWIIAGLVFSIYVENFPSFQVTFGSITAAVVLMLWLYNSAQILVLGAAFNTELERTTKSHATSAAPAHQHPAGN